MPEIVLVNTQIPENLGATARAMLNFNLKNLRVVSPFFELSNEKIIPLSAGADSVIKNIKKFTVFEDSVKDLNILIATTNRLRSLKKKQITFEKLNKIILNSKNKVGIIFGPEKSGLDEQVRLSIGIGEDAAVFSFLPEQAERILASSPLQLEGDFSGNLAAVAVLDWVAFANAIALVWNVILSVIANK